MGRIYGTINKDIAHINCKDRNSKLLDTDDLLICIDGEIDNKEKISQKLIINSNSDTKLLEELYKKYNEKFVSKIDGFFAIVIYDKKEKKLILVRDKIGAKQLYYYIDRQENSICFSSELKDIMNYPNFVKRINYTTLSMYFRYSYINPPNTIFENTYKLEHGHCIVCKNGKIINKTYWNLIEKYNELSKQPIKNFDEAKINLENIIKEYLEKVMNSNEKIGIYLSGGIDSSLVSAICSKLSKQPIETFSIGFYEKERNEAKKAKKIASYLRTNHHEMYISEEELLKTIKKIPEYYDEPFSDGSEIPTIILNEFAKKNNVKIAITGDGADQLFCGSTIYDEIDILEKIHKIFNPLNLNIKSKKNLNRRLYYRLYYIYANNDKRNQTQANIIHKEYYLSGLFNDVGEKRYNIEDKISNKSWQVKRMIVDLNTFLPNRINIKMNRSSNANEIDIKGPFLSNALIEYSFQISQKFKYYKKEKKYILKQILYDYVPKYLLNNKQKKGFGIPIKQWITTYLYDDLMKVSNEEFIKRQNIFNYEKLYKMIKEVKNKSNDKTLYQVLWDFYIFQLWYIKYIGS